MDIELVFIEGINKSTKYSSKYENGLNIKISESTEIVIRQGNINGQDILYEEIINEKLNLHEKNYLALQRYFDCKKVIRQKEQIKSGYDMYSIFYISPKIAFIEKSRQLYLYYPLYGSISKRNFPDNLFKSIIGTLYNLYIKFKVVLAHFSWKMVSIQFRQIKNTKYYSVNIIPFFKNDSIDESKSHKEKVDLFYQYISNLNDQDLSKFKDDQNEIKDKFQKIDLKFYDKAEKIEPVNYDDLFQETENLLYIENQKMIFNSILDEKDILPSFDLNPNYKVVNKLKTFENLLLLSMDEHCFDNLIIDILFHIYIYVNNKTKMFSLGDKVAFEKSLKAINQKTIEQWKINKILNYLDPFIFEEKDMIECIKDCNLKHKKNKELINNLVEFNKNIDKFENEKIEKAVQVINNYYFSFIQAQGDFYFNFGKLIKQYAKLHENIKFDITLIEKCFLISGYSTNNSEAFLQLAYIYSPSINKWKYRLNCQHYFIDQEKYKLYLSKSAYLGNQKAIKELARLFNNEKKYYNTIYTLFFLYFPENLDGFLIKASALEAIDLEESADICLNFAQFDINKIDKKRDYEETVYLILLARIQFFRLLFKHIDYISQFQTDHGIIDHSIDPLMQSIAKHTFQDKYDKKQKFSNIVTLYQFLLIFPNYQKMLEDFSKCSEIIEKIKSKKIKEHITEMSYEAEKILCDIELIRLYADEEYVKSKKDEKFKKPTIVKRLKDLFSEHNYFPASTRLTQLYFEIKSFVLSKDLYDQQGKIMNKNTIRINENNIKYIASDEEIEEIRSAKSNSFLLPAVNNDCFNYQMVDKENNYFTYFYNSLNKEDHDFVEKYNK